MTMGAIVCVDDRRDLLAALLRDLAEFEQEYDLFPCESANEAEEVIDEGVCAGSPLRLLITDEGMPGRSGTELLGQLNADARFRKVPKILLAGDETAASIRLGIAMGADGHLLFPHDLPPVNGSLIGVRAHGLSPHGLLPKPWRRDQLQRTVRALLY